MSELGAAPPALGTATISAMRSGLFWGAVGAMRELINRLSAGLPVPQVFLTGRGSSRSPPAHGARWPLGRLRAPFDPRGRRAGRQRALKYDRWVKHALRIADVRCATHTAAVRCRGHAPRQRSAGRGPGRRRFSAGQRTELSRGAPRANRIRPLGSRCGRRGGSLLPGRCSGRSSLPRWANSCRRNHPVAVKSRLPVTQMARMARTR